MSRIDLDPNDLADVLATLPASTLAGLLTPSQDWKARAAQLVAGEIVERLRRPAPHDANQLMLNIG